MASNWEQGSLSAHRRLSALRSTIGLHVFHAFVDNDACPMLASTEFPMRV